MLSTSFNHGRDIASPRSRDLEQGQELPVDNCCRPHPPKNRGRWTDRRSCPPRQGSALKGFFKEKEGAKRKSAKPPQATARLSFAALQDRRALPLSYVKNNVVTQDGPPCSGLSADMIGLRPITSHALQRHIPSCCSAGLAYPLGQAASRFLSGAVGLPVPLLQSPTLARRRRL